MPQEHFSTSLMLVSCISLSLSASLSPSFVLSPFLPVPITLLAKKKPHGWTNLLSCTVSVFTILHVTPNTLCHLHHTITCTCFPCYTPLQYIKFNPLFFIPIDSNRHELVRTGAVPVFVQLLDSSDEDVQFYCAAALSNLAVHCRSGRNEAMKVIYLSLSLSLQLIIGKPLWPQVMAEC